MHALLLAVLLTVIQQQPAPASLDGVVVNRVTGQPLPDTTVDLFDGGNGQRVTTGADGTFRFSNVTPGNEYHLVAIRSGSYLPFEYGQITPQGPGLRLALAPGQTLSGLRIEITPTGSISGRVVDSDGEPLVRGAVQALQTTWQNGEEVLTIVQSVMTNDRGEYRLFWLAPGSYTISVVARGWGSFAVAEPGLFGTRTEVFSPMLVERVRPDGTVVQEVARTVYYPQPIILQPGANIANIDMTAQSGPTRKISGTVVIEDGGQAPNGRIVEAIPRVRSPLSINPQTYVENGRFVLNGVLPGLYVVALLGPDGDVRVPLEVGNNDIENLQIVVRTFELKVRTASEGQPLRDSPESPITLRPLLPSRRDRIRSTNSSGTSVFRGLTPGDYRVELPQGSSYVKSMRLGDMEIKDNILHLDGPPSGSLDIVYPGNPSRIEGVAIDPDSKRAVRNAVVLLVPADRTQAELYREWNGTEVDGAFRFHGARPGDYKIFAWRQIEREEWRRPGFLAQYEARGVPIHIEDGLTANVNVEVLP